MLLQKVRHDRCCAGLLIVCRGWNRFKPDKIIPESVKRKSDKWKSSSIHAALYTNVIIMNSGATLWAWLVFIFSVPD